MRRGDEGKKFLVALFPHLPVLLFEMLRYYWTFIIGALLLIFIGIPVILIGHVLLKLFGIEDFMFPYAKFGCRVYLWSAGARIHVRGLEHLDRNQAYVFVSNHQSNLDPPLLFAYLGHNTGALAKAELFKIPIMKQGFPLVAVVPVDRSNRERAIESTRIGTATLKRGHSLMAFPEGTRTVDGRVKEFKKGVFYMALAAGVPIVPTIVNDTRLLMRRGEKRVVPGDVSLEVLPPIPTTDYSDETIDALVEKVRAQIVARVHTD